MLVRVKNQGSFLNFECRQPTQRVKTNFLYTIRERLELKI